MASAALQKRGKTSWGFTMPKPLAYLQLDNCYEHALAKARAAYGEDEIRHLHYEVNPTGGIQEAAAATWTRFVRDYEYCVRNFRSVMVDTATELMDVRKLAEFGKTTQIPQMYYGSIYADFRWMVNLALKSTANVLFIHRLKDEWSNGDRTGGYVMDGWRGVQFDSQIYVEHERNDEGEFITNIRECSQDAMLMGMALSSKDEENDFAALATRVFPDTDSSDWQ